MNELEAVDSKDLTLDEALQALVTKSTSDVAAIMSATRCRRCECLMGAIKHELRRRIPHYYWRITFECSVDGQIETRVLQTDWLVCTDPLTK